MNHNYFLQISFCIIITLILLSASSHFAQVKGGRWMFENNGNDEATWDEVENNGLLSGAVLYQNIDPLAQGSYYLSLEDSNNYGAFTVAHHSELNFKNKNFAASLWIYPIPNGSTSPQFLFLKGDRSGTVKLNNYALRLNNSHIEFIVHLESGEFKFKKSSFKVVDNEWLFVAVFYDTVQSKLYMWNEPESVPVDTFDFNESLFPNDLKLYVGTAGQNGHRRFFGRIDDLRISNSVSDILDNTTNIELSNINSHPSKFTLNQNYPNPFNPETSIRFSLAEEGFTQLDVYNLIGEQIVSLVRGEIAAGEHTIRFNASNLPSGIYFYQLQQGSRLDLKKMILIK
jgi:hypothetical protein